MPHCPQLEGTVEEGEAEDEAEAGPEQALLVGRVELVGQEQQNHPQGDQQQQAEGQGSTQWSEKKSRLFFIRIFYYVR